MPVGPLGRSVERHERELRDGQSGPELDRDPRQIGDLQGQRTLEARVDEPRGGVDDEPEAAEARFAFDSCHHVVGQPHPLQRPPQGELPGVDDEGRILVDHHLLGEIRRRLAQVDPGDPVVVEDPERVAEAQVHRGGLDHPRVPRVDLDVALGDETTDRAVGEDGGGARRHARRSLATAAELGALAVVLARELAAARRHRAHARRGGQRGGAVGVAAGARAPRGTRVPRLLALAAVATGLGHGLRLLLDRPPDDVQQPDDRDLQGDHEVDEGRCHELGAQSSRASATCHDPGVMRGAAG